MRRKPDRSRASWQVETPLQLLGLTHRRLLAFVSPIAAVGAASNHFEIVWAALTLVGAPTIFLLVVPIFRPEGLTRLSRGDTSLPPETRSDESADEPYEDEIEGSPAGRIGGDRLSTPLTTDSAGEVEC